jgi:hypothetical protein
MEFKNVEVKSVKANIGNKELTLTFALALDEASLAEAQELAVYDDKEHGRVDLTIVPKMPPLIPVNSKGD